MLAGSCSDGEQKLFPVPSGFVRVGMPQGEIASAYWNSFVMYAWLGSVLPGSLLGLAEEEIKFWKGGPSTRVLAISVLASIRYGSKEHVGIAVAASTVTTTYICCPSFPSALFLLLLFSRLLLYSVRGSVYAVQ